MTLPGSAGRMLRRSVCPVCQWRGGSLFFEMSGMPVHVGVQWPTQETARQCPKGAIALHHCASCGHVYNAAFDPALVEYTGVYDNALHYSPRFSSYTQALAERLVERYDLRGKHIVEIGSGQGDFLRLLARLGDNHGVGFDPSYEPPPSGAAAAERVTFVQDFYSEQHAAQPADFICSRFVFEHIPDPVGFLRMVRRAAGSAGDSAAAPAVYFEVPNVSLILRDLSIWDIIYEHCSFFSAPSLAHAFGRAGFHVHDLYEAYAGQFLGIEAALPHARMPDEALPNDDLPPDERMADERARLQNQVRRFRTSFAERKAAWHRRLARLRHDGKRVVLWGAGAKAVSFMNLLAGEDAAAIDYVVDINPNKHGLFLAGSGQQIVPPDALVEYGPDAVVVMNPVYQNEIQASLSDLGIPAEILCAS